MLADQVKGEDSFVTTKGINPSLKMNKQPYSTFFYALKKSLAV